MFDGDSGKRLYLLDGMALIYRAHYALIRSPRFTSGGVCTSAVFGMANTVLDLLKNWQPSHMAIAFDTAEPTHRHTEFPEYKAQRDELPEDIEQQFPLVDKLLAAMRIPVLEVPGYEADDIIGTLARRADADGFRVWMVTPDKDFDQLVSEHVCVLRPGRQGSAFEVFDVDRVLAKWQIERIDQVVDILGLMGDASDNVPGVPGIGEKTAQKLIAQFGSMENLLASTDRLSGKQKQQIETHREQALLSRRLVTIMVDVPMELDWDQLKCQPFDEDKLQKLFVELEFETLGQRLFGKSFSASAAKTAVIRERREREIQAKLFDEPVEEKTLREVSHVYKIVATPAERAALLKQLQAQKSFAWDTESTGLDARTAAPVGMSFSWQPETAFYVPIPDDPAAAQARLAEFLPVLANPAIEKVGHNLKYDVTLLKWRGLEIAGPFFDTMLAHSMKEPEMTHGLDYLAKLYLGYHPIPITDLIGPEGPNQVTMRDVPVEQVAEYACEDADVTWKISQILRPDLEAQGASRVCFEVECPLVPVLVDMEYEGIRLDVPAIRAYSEVLGNEIEQLKASVFAAAGREFNLDSPRQLGTVLFDELKLIDRPKKTSTGQYSTREAELMRLAGKHPIIRDVLEYRNAVKLKTVYVDQLPSYVNSRTGRLHTHYSQVWTATGRMQSNEPNLQTIPVRKERGREIRAAFIPRDKDYSILSADYSQIELRIMAELSGDEGLMEAFDQGADIHTTTAAKIYKVEPDQVTSAMRDKAKMVNFGIPYGISAFGLQQRIDISRGEANDLIRSYFEKYPGVRAYIDRTIESCREKGYVETLMGRRRYIRDINSRNQGLRSAAERLAMNSPLQGTAADLLKLAMIKVHQALRDGGFRTKMLLTVHDEIVFDLHKSEQETAVPLIVACMTTALPLRVPLRVETGIGPNWFEAK
jgi:DNA polymerase-1